MAVLIEALTLVVRKFDLDTRYPGGTRAFLEATLELDEPPRFVCDGDEHLVNLSFYNPDHLRACTQLLVEHGFVDVEDNKVADMAFGDQWYGPTMPCNWLEWRIHKDGFTLAWMPGTDNTEMAAPPDWTPERSRGMKRSDVRDEPGRAIKLAEEDGIETWLDFRTGKQVVGLPHRGPPPPHVLAGDENAEPEASLEDLAEAFFKSRDKDLLQRVVEVLDERSLHYEHDEELDQIAVAFESDVTSFTLTFSVDARQDLITCITTIPERFANDQLAAASELVCRANFGLSFGRFELDHRDGEIRFHIANLLESGTIPHAIIDRMLDAGLGVFEIYYSAFARVSTGMRTPAEAIAEVES